MSPTWLFTREPLRTPFTLVLLVAVPALFVVSSAGVLRDFAAALGGSLAGDAAAALGAGWAAAFVSGALGFFQSASSRGADRRLALAGLGPAKVATARIAASVLLAALAALAAFVTLELQVGIEHPWHAVTAILAFALLYVSVGVLIGSIISAPLEGSLLVVFVFLLDAFSGPGMSSSAAPWSISRKAADVLIASAMGEESPAGDWIELVAVSAAALVAAFGVFVVAARRRT